MQRSPQESSKPHACQFPPRDLNHRFVRRHLGQPPSIDLMTFQKNERRLHTSSLIAIKKSLTLRDVKRVGGRNFEQVTSAVVVDVFRLRDCRLQATLIPQSPKTAKPADLLVVNCVNNLTSQELRLPVQGHLARRRNNPSCNAEVLRISSFALLNDISRSEDVPDGALASSSCDRLG